MSGPPKVKSERKLYPILQTAPGSNFMKPAVVKGDPRKLDKDTYYTTYNPLKEGEPVTFKCMGKDGKEVTVTMCVDMNFYSVPDFFIGKILEVK